jgi:splicing factor U2AF subunit
LTDVVPILERKRRLTQWDIKPAGYENITAEQAKMSGMYPLPGAPQAQRQPMDPQRLQAFMNQPGNQASQTALKPNTARQSKRLLIYNISEALTDSGIVDFFNLQLNGLNVTRNNDPCVSAHISKDRSFALLEFKTPEDATTAMTLINGVNVDASTATSNGHSNGTSAGLRIERPKDYIVPTVTADGDSDTGAISNVVPDTQNKLTVANLPVNLDEAQIVELLQSFGALKSFTLVSYTGEDVSRGVAFLEYKDSAHTEVAIEGLNGMDLGSMPLKISRACIGTQQVGGEMSVNAMSMMAGTKANEFSNGRVLCLMNMITPAELMDAEEADGMLFIPLLLVTKFRASLTHRLPEILEDITEECAKFGTLLDTKMPRPVGGARQGNGVGKIYLKYESPDSAAKALAALAGRNFSGRTVVVTYFSEEYFDLSAW